VQFLEREVNLKEKLEKFEGEFENDKVFEM